MPDRVPEDRCIFSFWDGTRQREVDPMEAGIVLEAECPEYVGLLEEVSAPPAVLPPGGVATQLAGDKRQAAEKLLTVTRKMFGVTPFRFENGVRSGLTRAETFDLMTDFILFLSGLSKKAAPFSNSQPRASPCPSTPSGATAAPSSASGSVGG